MHNTRFEHSTFAWDTVFHERLAGRLRFYVVESKVAVEEEGTFDTSAPLTAKVIVERFLDYGCAGDRERYLYRNFQIESFLKGLNFGELCHGIVPSVKEPLILLDDRQVLDGPPTAMTSNQKVSTQTLSAHELYKNLREAVGFVLACLRLSLLDKLAMQPAHKSRGCLGRSSVNVGYNVK